MNKCDFCVYGPRKYPDECPQIRICLDNACCKEPVERYTKYIMSRNNRVTTQNKNINIHKKKVNSGYKGNKR